MSTIIQADVVFTNAGSPLKNGGVEMDDQGVILGVFSSEEMKNKKADKNFEGFLIPGFVNAHCHLELSFAVARIERNKGINSFIERLEHLKKTIPHETKMEAIDYALEVMTEEGIVAVGDICNTNLTAHAKDKSAMCFRNFVEVYGLDDKLAEEKMQEAQALKTLFRNASIVPHSTYSLSESLLKLIDNQLTKEDFLSIHNQESDAENQYFREGKGEMVERFKAWGLKIPDYIPSGKSPVETFATMLNIKDYPVIFVHNTFSSALDLDFIGNHFRNPSLCLCPSSNLFIEQQLPIIQYVMSSGINTCLGTDSLASNDTLSVLQEMKILMKAFPEIRMETLIQWATINGAQALGFSGEIGSFEVGKKPGVLLIEEVNLEEMKLTDFSFVSVVG